MSIKTKVRVLPNMNVTEHIEINKWADFITNNLNLFMRDVKDDFDLGNENHKIFSSAPVVTQLAEGEIVFSQEAANFYLYTRINSNLKRCLLS